MTTRTNSLIALSVTMLIGASPEASGGKDGKSLYRGRNCVACHGDGGAQPIHPDYPKLAGQNAAYLARQIKDIRDGVRDSGQTALMRPMVQGLTDAQADAIAQYLAAER